MSSEVSSVKNFEAIEISDFFKYCSQKRITALKYQIHGKEGTVPISSNPSSETVKRVFQIAVSQMSAHHKSISSSHTYKFTMYAQENEVVVAKGNWVMLVS